MGRKVNVNAVLAISVFLIGLAGNVSAGTIYVDDNAVNDPNPGNPDISDPVEDGSPEHPFDAIQEGINAAFNGDTVMVLDGTYTGTGNRDIDFNAKAITLTSENGPENCIVDCQSSGRGFYFHSGEDQNSVLNGFTITHGGGGSSTVNFGYAIYCYGGSPTISNCLITENCVEKPHGGDEVGPVCVRESNCILKNCIITRNRPDVAGGVYCWDSSLVLLNCTISDNTGGGIECIGSGIVTVINCILWGNSGGEIYGPASVNYSNIQGGWSGLGNNNIHSDPNFVNPVNNDYHLLATSPCIDAGDNTVVTEPNDFDGLERIVDGDCDSTATVDMGAYEFDWLYLGDFAGGCNIDLGDFAVLAQNFQQDNPAIDIAPFLGPDGVIDLKELLVMVAHWLEGTD